MCTTPVISISATQRLEYHAKVCLTLEEIAIYLLADLASMSPIIFVDDGLPFEHQEHLEMALLAQGIQPDFVKVTGGEENKRLNQVLRVIEHLNIRGVKRRSSPPIALGGGVVLDIVGMACSLYRRGIPYIRIPTTLLAMVDVGIAAKTGVNHLGYRNRIGSFHPASVTYVYQDFVDTLTLRQLSNGLGEIFKLALIKNESLFNMLLLSGSNLLSAPWSTSPASQSIIVESLVCMAEELAPNLWEANLQRLVDYGHSFSPLIEMNVLPELLHGEAVALDCLLSAAISFGRGFLRKEALEKIFDLAIQLGLPTYHDEFANPDRLWDALDDTKIHRNGEQNLPIMDKIGHGIFVNDLDFAEVCTAAAVFQEYGRSKARDESDRGISRLGKTANG